MDNRRLFVRDPFGSALTGAALGLAVGVLQWWGGINDHNTSYAVVVGVGLGFAGARLVYARGVEPKLAVALFAIAVAGLCLVLGTVEHVAARVVAGTVMLAIGLLGLRFAWRLTPGQAKQGREAGRPFWANDRLRWIPSPSQFPGFIYALPMPLARLLLATVPLLLCVFAVALLLGRTS